jgi:hypothetical protein
LGGVSAKNLILFSLLPPYPPAYTHWARSPNPHVLPTTTPDPSVAGCRRRSTPPCRASASMSPSRSASLRLAHVVWDTEEGKRGQLTEDSREGKPGSDWSRLQTAAPTQGSRCVRQHRRSQPRGGSRWRVPDAATWVVGRKWPTVNVMRAAPRVV